MGIESFPNQNIQEDIEPQEIKTPEEVVEATPVLPTAENINEADIAARQEADARKLAKLREQMGLSPETVQGKNELSATEMESFKQELSPIFDDRFVTYGHGTRLEAAEQIIKEGLQAKQAPNLDTTAYGLENSDEGLNKILHWPHLDAKAIIVVMLPKTMERSHGGVGFDEHLWEESDNELNPNRLPAKYIKGYIDVEKRKLVLNSAFEENPEMPEPKIYKSTLEDRPKKSEKPIEVPSTSSDDSSPEIW